MHFEPASISREAIVRLLADTYSIEATAVAFIPVGAATACYRVDSHGGGAFFVKAWPDTPGSAETSARQEVILPLLRLLDECDLAVALPIPVLAYDSRPFSYLPGTNVRVAVFPFIEGQSPDEDAGVEPRLIVPLAEAIAAYHAAPPLPPASLPPVDLLEVECAELLRDAFVRMAAVTDNARPGLLEARARIAPRAGEIEAHLARAAEFRDRAHRLHGSRVLCHTDLGGSNLLVDEMGELVLLDWDEALVAPPEHDLQAAASSPHFAEFLRTYREAGGADELHLDHFAFYLVRRYLEDLAHRLLLLLDYNTTDAEDEDALYGAHAYGFERLDALDELLVHIAASLREAGYR